MAVAGQDQVDAGSFEIAVEQQMRVGDDNGVRRSMPPLNGLDIGTRIRIQMRAQIISGRLGVEFTDEAQWGHHKRLIFI